MIYNYTGIILEKYDVGETDRIYTIYTLEAGKIRTIAKGVRKPQAKLTGHLENFTLVDISLARSRGMGKITGAIAENNFPRLKNNLESLTESFKAAKVLDKLVKEEEKDERIFKLFLEYLKTIDSKSATPNIILPSLVTQGFIFKLFDCLGYKIEANTCVKCGSLLSQNGNYFSAERGGILCGNCSISSKNKIKVSANSIKIIRVFFKNSINSLAKLKVEPKEINNLKIISGEFFRWIV